MAARGAHTNAPASRHARLRRLRGRMKAPAERFAPVVRIVPAILFMSLVGVALCEVTSAHAEMPPQEQVTIL